MFLLDFLLLGSVHGGDRTHGADGPHSGHGTHGKVPHGCPKPCAVAHRTSGTENKREAGYVSGVNVVFAKYLRIFVVVTAFYKDSLGDYFYVFAMFLLSSG